MSYINRATIVEALIAAGVEFDPAATVVDLRPLYDRILNELDENGELGLHQVGELNGRIDALNAELQQAQQQLAAIQARRVAPEMAAFIAVRFDFGASINGCAIQWRRFIRCDQVV